ncbi:uncharacterized protein PITG_22752 [Phytophthora infestans T30-4]|uniref:Uncharacterized protein n=1 Tax=Phytophthora infestans (strain T30-4) TaxID=403677 RepID=D0N2L4_PHYIT|nr:uncharacterized protein PITG_22752 [Phytophthora infestans T30-4]EEY68543.1 conserved hypothetical protein [Phytophthora infestans T30-4]|eukprot:XP_002905702.1 conserved hypothetical protein [Phytophthora infestans T30-4]
MTALTCTAPTLTRCTYSVAVSSSRAKRRRRRRVRSLVSSLLASPLRATSCRLSESAKTRSSSTSRPSRTWPRPSCFR